MRGREERMEEEIVCNGGVKMNNPGECGNVGLACILEHSPVMWNQTSGTAVARKLMGTQDGR